jgi:hypothetical protein
LRVAPYSTLLTGLGDKTKPQKWSWDAQKAPQGLTLAEVGAVGGPPVRAGKYRIPVKAVSPEGRETRGELAFEVGPGKAELAASAKAAGHLRTARTLLAEYDRRSPAPGAAMTSAERTALLGMLEGAEAECRQALAERS